MDYSKNQSILGNKEVKSTNGTTNLHPKIDSKIEVNNGQILCKKEIGIKQLNNNGYLNSCIQSLIHLKKLNNYFIENQNEIKNLVETSPLSHLFCEVVCYLMKKKNNENKPYDPKFFHKLLSYLNPMFKGNAVKDAIDCLIFLLDKLNKELKRQTQNKINTPIKFEENEEESFRNYNKLFNNNNNSIISDLFCWTNKKEKICLDCGNKTFLFQYFYTFDLEFKKLFNKINSISIQQCLNNILTEKKTFNIYCYECRRKVMCFNNFFFIHTLPNIFVLVLKDIIQEKNKIEIKFNQIIEINAKKYCLKSVIAFENERKSYISYCLSLVDQSWYVFKDEEVEKIDFKEILEMNQKETVPVIFFYEAEN